MKYALATLAAVICLTGCTTTKKIRIQSCPECPDKSVKESNIRGAPYAASEALGPVYFDFDKANLRKDATGTLAENYGVLLSNPKSDVLVEGHCDERGSTAYNLGLGQKRAKAIRDYYMSLGMDGGKIGTISYGEEQPVCKESDEKCWQKNRRGETKVR